MDEIVDMDEEDFIFLELDPALFGLGDETEELTPAAFEPIDPAGELIIKLKEDEDAAVVVVVWLPLLFSSSGAPT